MITLKMADYWIKSEGMVPTTVVLRYNPCAVQAFVIHKMSLHEDGSVGYYHGRYCTTVDSAVKEFDDALYHLRNDSGAYDLMFAHDLVRWLKAQQKAEVTA